MIAMLGILFKIGAATVIAIGPYLIGAWISVQWVAARTSADALKGNGTDDKGEGVEDSQGKIDEQWLPGSKFLYELTGNNPHAWHASVELLTEVAQVEFATTVWRPRRG